MYFSCAFHFSVFFMKSASFYTKGVTFHENQQNQVNMCVYMYHLHIHAPPNTTKIYIYLVGLLSVLYETQIQNERSVLNQLGFFLFFCFCFCFSVLFMCFSHKVPLFIHKVPLFTKTKPGQYVCIHAPCTHTCTTCNTKYYHNIRYTFPLYSMKHQVKMTDLCSISCFCCFSCAFHVLFMKSVTFHKKGTTFHETNKTRSVCVYTCTI